jgi:hypothetical protein
MTVSAAQTYRRNGLSRPFGISGLLHWIRGFSKMWRANNKEQRGKSCENEP